MAKNKSNETTALATFDPTSVPGLGKADGDSLASILAGGEILPPVISLDEPGRYIEGVYEGPGQEVEYNDPTGDTRPLPTHRFRLESGVRVDVIGAHQLNKSLPAFVGHRLAVVKGAVKKVGAKQVNQYLISDKGPSDT